MRKALVIGINHYESISNLFGCVDDAYSVKASLERHSDGTKNFDVKILCGTEPDDTVTRAKLKESLSELFANDSEIALFYFAGHGYLDSLGGYLCTTDCTKGDEGVSLNDVLTLANNSKAKNKVILLDSCYSGIAGDSSKSPARADLAEGLTVLTASTAEQYAMETSRGGIYTELLIDALNGAAGNLVGDVTPGSVYAHIDQSLGPWQQRPVFKTNVKNFVSLRKVQPPIALSDLQKISVFFPHAGYDFPLDPSYEPEGPNPNPKNTAIFSILQKYYRVNLLIPVNAPHMYHAAMESKSCKLTVLGEHYRRLVEQEKI